MSYENFFWAKTSVQRSFQALKTERNIAKKAIKARVIGVQITWVFNYTNYRYPMIELQKVQI